jgi:hypothetical protein
MSWWPLFVVGLVSRFPDCPHWPWLTIALRIALFNPLNA